MSDDPAAPFAHIQQCEAAIGRIRAAIHAGQQHSDQVTADLAMIQGVAHPIFARRARQVAWISPLAVEEAFEALDEQLFKDVWKTTFPSLETGFGAYLKTMPVRMLDRITRKNLPGNDSSPVERLDMPTRDDGLLLHETVGDVRSTATIEGIADREAMDQALQQLPPMERRAFELRYAAGLSNNDLAQQLGVSAPTASRLVDRAKTHLARILRTSEEL